MRAPLCRRRRLRFAGTPKQLGQQELTHRSLWPQYLVITLDVLAVPVGVLLFVRKAPCRTEC